MNVRLPALMALLPCVISAAAVAQLGTHQENYLLAMVYATGDTSPGGQTTFVYRSPADYGKYCIMALSTSDQPLALGDDDNQTVQLGFSFTFFGQTYTECRVCSNGRLNFGGSSSQANNYQARWNGTGTTFRSGSPSIGFWSDWSPNQGGTVMVITSPNQFRVVFSGVPSYNGPGVGDFQIVLTPSTFTLQDNGTTWMGDDNCIVGFTPGGNISAQGSLNVGALLPLPTTGNNATFGEDFNPSTNYDLGVGFTATANNATASHWAVQ